MSAEPSPSTAFQAVPDRITELDGLRGMAIALVLWWHLVCPALPIGRESLLGWLRAGTNLTWSGVDLFFVLSGYFIGGILIDQRDSPRLARVFYLRRALRILPLYYITLATCATAAWLGYLEPHYSLWGYVFFVSNFQLGISNVWDAAPLTLLWSVAVEEQFYLTAPWVVRLLSPRGLPWFVAGLIVLAVALRSLAHVLFPGAWMASHLLSPFRMDTLSLGVLIAWAVRHERARAVLALLGRRWAWWFAASLLFLLALSAHNAGLGSPLMVYAGYDLLALIYGLWVVLVVVVRPPALIHLLSLRPLVSLGRHSYFIYLWHMLIGDGVFRLLGGLAQPLGSPRILLAAMAGIAATWLAGIASWRVLESPLIAIGKRQRY